MQKVLVAVLFHIFALVLSVWCAQTGKFSGCANKIQKLNYDWRHVSGGDVGQVPFSAKGAGNILEIPAGAMLGGKTYVFENTAYPGTDEASKATVSVTLRAQLADVIASIAGGDREATASSVT